MTITDIVAITTAISALISAIAATIWGHGLTNVKDELIKVKESQIESLCSAYELNLKAKDMEIGVLHELTPMKIREYFQSVKTQMEEQIDYLRTELAIATKSVDDKNLEIRSLKSSGKKQETELLELKEQYSHIEVQMTTLFQVEDDFSKLTGFINNIDESRLGLRLLNQLKNRELKQEQEVISCPVCYNQVDAGYSFCDKCGATLKELPNRR